MLTSPPSPGPLNRRALESLAVLAFATAYFLHIYGVDVLDPTRTAWMLHGDPAQHYLGWLFFAGEPWAWPPGRIAGFGYPQGTAVVFTDSIPLLALLFKPLAAWLPAGWHYFGGWMLACYALNGYFGLRLVAHLTDRTVLRVLGAGFFVVVPPVLLRSGGHESLMAHWLLLAAIELHLSGWRTGRWLALCVVASLVHPYLLLMVLGLLGAAALQETWVLRRVAPKQVGTRLLAIGAATGTAMALAGYFSSHGPVAAGGFGFFSMNLNAWWDPWFDWSRFLKQRPMGTGGQYEGFMYLGAGMLLLGVMAAGIFAAQPSRPPRALWPLLAVAAAFWCLALSNRVMFGDKLLWTVPLPADLKGALSVFRASGRFGWVAFYLLHLGIFWTLLKALPARLVAALLALGLVLQVTDQGHKHQEFRKTFAGRAQWVSPLQSPQWAQMAAGASALVIVPPHAPMEEIYQPFALLAGQHHLPTNAAHIARTPDAVGDRAGEAAAQALRAGQAASRVMYVFPDQAWRDQVPDALRSRLVTLDGILVMAP